jgi:hypothetical protein
MNVPPILERTGHSSCNPGRSRIVAASSDKTEKLSTLLIHQMKTLQTQTWTWFCLQASSREARNGWSLQLHDESNRIQMPMSLGDIQVYGSVYNALLVIGACSSVYGLLDIVIGLWLNWVKGCPTDQDLASSLKAKEWLRYLSGCFKTLFVKRQQSKKRPTISSQ